MFRSVGKALSIVAATAVTLSLSGTGAQAAPAGIRPAATVNVRLIGMNDFHGNLEPPAGSSGRVTQADGTTVDAGGAVYIATHVKHLEAVNTHSLLLSA